MMREELMFVGTCDLAGHVRGKAFPTRDWDGRRSKGVGYTHSNIMMSAFGPIDASPFTTAGDLVIRPDPSTRVDVPFDPDAGEHFCLGDICTLDGAPWDCCPRDALRRGLAALGDLGFELLAAFEQEFVYTGVADQPGRVYALDTLRQAGVFGEVVTASLRAAGLQPDSFLPEYGPRQFEITVAPTPGMRAADEAVIAREILRAVAQRLGQRVILSPMLRPDGIGNGTHVHFSLIGQDGAPSMHDPDGEFGLSVAGRHFVAGIVAHLPALSAITAPSVASYMRLTPNRWAPTLADLGAQDRGVAVRVCPVFATAEHETRERQFNVEYRVSDAAASPYMTLAAIVHAGVDGLRRKLDLPAAGTARMLPRSLTQALDLLEADKAIGEAFGPGLMRAYVMLKRAEAAKLDGMDDEAICNLYAETY